ncbi:MAG: PEP-CTERM sorting domain-containing protein [Akkermansiaceae bacterium]
MKKHILPLSICTFLPLAAAHSAVTTIDLDLSRAAGTSSRTNTSHGSISSIVANAGSAGGADQSIQYTVTGLTLDSVGTADDSITFTMGLLGASTTGAVAGMAASFEYWGVNDGTGTGSLVEPDETLRFDFDGSTISLGAGATETASLVFDGFEGFELLNTSAGETFNITGTTNNNVTNQAHAGQEALNSFTGFENTFTYGGSNGAMRIGGVRAQVTITTVPEPSSALLLGLGSLAVVMRRRR